MRSLQEQQAQGSKAGLGRCSPGAATGLREVAVSVPQAVRQVRVERSLLLEMETALELKMAKD